MTFDVDIYDPNDSAKKFKATIWDDRNPNSPTPVYGYGASVQAAFEDGLYALERRLNSEILIEHIC